MKTIPLTRGIVALVDDDDFERLNKHKWFSDSFGYAVRRMTIGKKKQIVIRMHREIFVEIDANTHVDHINGNPSDNRRANLRACTHAQNCKNRGKGKNNTTGFKGVSFEQGAWVAKIMKDGKSFYLGRHESPEHAYEMYCLAADMLHGEFANYGA